MTKGIKRQGNLLKGLSGETTKKRAFDTMEQISDTHVLLQDTLNRGKTYSFSF